jgi:hypothetical protein
MKSLVLAGILIVLSALCVGSSESADRLLVSPESIDHLTVACGCSFREALPGTAMGGSQSGPDLLVIAPNADPPYALVNVGKGNVQLHAVKAIEFPLYQCEGGQRFVSEWKSDDVALLAKFQVAARGMEACWLSGTVRARTAKREAEIAVKGACGC